MKLIQTKPEHVDVLVPTKNETWVGLEKYDLFSRWRIKDNAFDELINFIPMEQIIRQTPGPSATIATLPGGTAIWMAALTLNLATYIFVLSTNGHLYQISTGGVITDVSTTTPLSAKSDITVWQGTTILISDVNVSKVYSWNGTTFATVFTGQPAQFITVYSSRLWMSNNNTITFTAGGTFNSLGGDSGSFTISDEDTQPSILAMVPFLGSLFVFGPDWIQQISGLYDSGSPPVLQFQRVTLESQVGVINKWSIISLGAYLYFGNSSGFWRLEGIEPVQVSPAIDGFFQNFGAASSFSAAYSYIYNVPCLFWNVIWNGDGLTTNFGITVEEHWFRTQSGTVVFITDAINNANGLQTIWATDGTNIFTLYTNLAAPVSSSFQTKMFDSDYPIQTDLITYAGVQQVLTNTSSETITLVNEFLQIVSTQSFSHSQPFTWTGTGGAPFTWTTVGGAPFTWTGGGTSASLGSAQYVIDQYGPSGCYLRSMGINYNITSVGATVHSIAYQYKPTPSVWGLGSTGV